MEDLKKIQEFFSKPLEENVDKKYSDFLVALRDSGITNMFGAAPYLQAEFGLDKREAREVLANWMRSFGESLNEGKQLDIEDFAKVVQAVTKTGHPVTVLLTPKFNEIEVLTGMNAPDDMLFDLSNAVDSLGYGRNDIIIAGDSSNLSRREYSDIRRVNGGHKDYFEESVNENALGFNDSRLSSDQHRDLDYAVRGDSAYTFGNDPYADDQLRYKYAVKMGFLEEYNTGIYYDPTKERNAPKAKEASKSGLEKVRDFVKKVMKEEEITVDDATEFKLNLKHLLDKHVVKNEALSDYEEEEANYDELYSDYKYKVNEAKPKKGHGEKISKEVFAKLKGKTINYKGQDYKVVDSDEAVLTLKDEDGKSKTINLRQFNVSGMIDEIMETIELGKNLNEELCPKGKAYIKKRQAAGEKSSAYLSGRAVKVCKGQMKG